MAFELDIRKSVESLQADKWILRSGPARRSLRDHPVTFSKRRLFFNIQHPLCMTHQLAVFVICSLGSSLLTERRPAMDPTPHPILSHICRIDVHTPRVKSKCFLIALLWYHILCAFHTKCLQLFQQGGGV
jgi:hypothetical protein